MPVGGFDFTVDAIDAAASKLTRQGLHLGGWKKPIGGDAHEGDAGFDAAIGVDGAVFPDGVEGVHGFRDAEIRIGIEPLYEFLALMIEITAHQGEKFVQRFDTNSYLCI